MRAIFLVGILILFATSAFAQTNSTENDSASLDNAANIEESTSKESSIDEQEDVQIEEEPLTAEQEPTSEESSTDEQEDVQIEEEPLTAKQESTSEESVQAEEKPNIDPASNSPVSIDIEANHNTLNTRLSGRSRSEMFMSQQSRMRSLGAGTYGIRKNNVYPFIETIELRADEIGHKGLSIHFQGWFGLDLADIHYDERFVADPTYLYLQFRDYGADIRLGRQMIFTGTAQGLHVDGIYASYESPIHIGVEAHGGLVVSPKLGPDWYRDEVDINNIDSNDFGAGFTDWGREGDYAVGGRLFYRITGKFSAGASILHVTHLEEIDYQLFGIDLDMTPASWIGASGNATMDIVSARLREANVALDFYPWKFLNFSTEYRHADPTLYLSHMSIFSVFSTEQYDSVGASVRIKPTNWLHFNAGYHQHFYSFIEETIENSASSYSTAIDSGYDLHAGASILYGKNNKGTILLNYRRFAEKEQGANQLRLGAIIPLPLDGLKASSNAYLDIYDIEINETNIGFLGDLGMFYGNDTFDVGASISAGTTPYSDSELRGMLKFVYNFDKSFVERRQL